MSKPPALPDPAGSHRSRPTPPTGMAQLWFALTGPTLSGAHQAFSHGTRPSQLTASAQLGSAGMTKARGRAMLGAVAHLNRGRATPTLQPFPAGGYRFISHQFQYSGGVAAEPGFRIERAREALSPLEAAKHARVTPAMKGASFGAATSRPRQCARKRSFAFSRGRRSHFDKAVSATVA
jgi:hypothetical protein